MGKFHYIFVMISASVVLLFTACTSMDEVDKVGQKVAVSVEAPVTVVASQDYPHYKNVEHLSERADAIIRGTIVDTRVEEIDTTIKSKSENEETKEQLNPGGEAIERKKLYTVYSIKIEEVYKGNSQPGDTLDFMEPASQAGDTTTTVVVGHGSEISSEHNYIFFLYSYATFTGLMNPIQSLYIYHQTDNTITSVHPQNDLTLSLEDLRKISNKY